MMFVIGWMLIVAGLLLTFALFPSGLYHDHEKVMDKCNRDYWDRMYKLYIVAGELDELEKKEKKKKRKRQIKNAELL